MDPIDSNKVNFLVRGDNFLLLPRKPLFLGHKSCLVVIWHEKLIWQIVILGKSR